MKKKPLQQNTSSEKGSRADWLTLLRSAFLAMTALVVAIVSTVAWFASNQHVNSSGMSTQVKTSANLIISDDPNTLKTMTVKDSAFHVTFEGRSDVLTAARHSTDAAGTQLIYNKNPKDIDKASGTAKKGETASFEAVPVFQETDTRRYYYDYTVYIASAGEEFHANKLNTTMAVTPAEEAMDYFQAVSIDFYLDGTYKGTLNAAGKNWETSADGVTSLNVAPDGLDLPLNTTGQYHTVLMRCYFDGGLMKDATTAYVRSNGLTIGSFSLQIGFEAVE